MAETGKPLNAGQIEYWNSPVTAPWVALQDRLDLLFAPLAGAGLQAAQVVAGEQVLDVGCGCGATVLELAAKVGPTGHVTGVDVSSPMLERARARVREAQLANASLVCADASVYPLTSESLDLVFSRLGVMFFADPVAAFRNLHGALKPQGRLAFICIRNPVQNPFTMTAVHAARPLLPPDALPAPRPEEPGMFSFADRDRVVPILTAAGFRDVQLLPFTTSQCAWPGPVGRPMRQPSQ